MASIDIPGFYRDPLTGKYFREKPFEENEGLKRIKLERQALKVACKKSHNSLCSVPHYLRRHELGAAFGSQIVLDYYKSRTATKTSVDSVDLRNSNNNLTDVEYIKSGSSSIFGLWRSSNLKYPYALGEIHELNKEPKLFPEFLKYTSFVQDMSEIFPDSIILVQNDYGNTGTINFIRKDQDSNPYSFLAVTRSFPLYCCAAAYLNFIRIVVGGVNSIFYYKELTPLKKYDVEGRTMTVTFDDTKQLIISGQSSGHVYMHDLRADNPAFVSKIETGKNKCLVDSLFLPPNKIFITGVNNKLVLFDIRALQPVAEFLGHKQSVKKHALSFGNNLLCANGADNRIRLWHQSGGSPINEICPSNPRNQIRGCLKTDGNTTQMYCFEGSMKNIFQL